MAMYADQPVTSLQSWGYAIPYATTQKAAAAFPTASGLIHSQLRPSTRVHLLPFRSPVLDAARRCTGS